MITFTKNINGNTKKGKFKILMLVILALAGISLVGTLIMLLWNWLMPDIFGFQKISLIQGFGLLILAKILFGGMESNTNSKPNYNNLDQNTQSFIKESIHQEIEKNNIKDYALGEATDADELYEEWWSKEGEAHFEEFLTKKSDTDD